ncbi:MAG: primary-amine oxidase [Candidatus Acidiferrales bacterium]
MYGASLLGLFGHQPRRKRRGGVGAMALVFLAAFAAPAAAQSPQHPLDGLTAPEFWSLFEVMKASGRTDEKTRYSLITLHEPPKEEVLRWKPGQAFPREALAVVRQETKTYEVVVDLSARKTVLWREIKDVQPNLTMEELREAGEAVKENPDWQAAMRRRGITDFETVHCYGISPGFFGTPEEQGRRLQRVVCTDGRGTWNPDARPIEGLIVLWDADAKKVMRIIDTGPVAVPRTAADYDAELIGPLREVPTPLTVEQPLGPSFRVSGHEVSWQKWSFQFRLDPRVGLVVSSVRYADGDRVRSVLYQGSLSEIFVPYMDPNEGWYHWTYFDAGEFPFFGFGTPLEPGSDCPENAVYFDNVYADERALPHRVRRGVCLFERYAGDIAWRHRGQDDIVESRRRRDLVLRTIATFGNYDYLFDWVFLQDGTIKVVVAATGIDAVKAVAARTAAEDRDGRAQAYGRFIAENTVAVNHDHFFSFRLDLDVDGIANSFVQDQLRTERLPESNPRKSLWVAVSETLRTEQQARLHISMEKPAVWRVVNQSVKSPLGYPVGYEIKPGHNAMTLLLPDDFPQRRAGFTQYQLWVTPYRPDERHAAGEYVTQSKGGDGLPAWTSADRPIENTDLVVWYTVGMHHVPRSEDFPVMPTSWHEFELRPYNFFARNPALDLPASVH